MLYIFLEDAVLSMNNGWSKSLFRSSCTLIIKLILESKKIEDMFRNVEDSPVLNPIEDDDGLLDHGRPR